MANRTRNKSVNIRLTDKEKQLFEKKKEEIKSKNLSHLVRKRVLEAEIYEVDLTPFIDMQESLKEITTRLNEVAKRVNATGIIYNDDVEDMKTDVTNLRQEIKSIHNLLLGK